MKAEVVLGHSYRLKATPPAGVEVIAVAKRAFGLRSWTLCGDRAAATTVSRQGVAQGVAVDLFLSTKCWSEWQDLNLRPPRPERGALRTGPRRFTSWCRQFLCHAPLFLESSQVQCSKWHRAIEEPQQSDDCVSRRAFRPFRFWAHASIMTNHGICDCRPDRLNRCLAVPLPSRKPT